MATASALEAHRAKMQRKAARVLTPGFTPMDDKRFARRRLEMQLNGQRVFPNVSKSILTRTSIAQVNRHTGKAHAHQREIARRVRQAA